MVLEDTGSEAYMSKSGKGVMIKAMKDYTLWAFFLCASKREIQELLDGKRSVVKLKTLMGRADSEPE